jgi:hypothetical protein
MAFAHATIIDPREGRHRYEPGDQVPDDLPGLDELVEAGSVSDEEYVPPVEETAAVNLVSVAEIDENTVQIGDKVYTLSEVHKTASDDAQEAQDAR